MGNKRAGALAAIIVVVAVTAGVIGFLFGKKVEVPMNVVEPSVQAVAEMKPETTTSAAVVDQSVKESYRPPYFLDAQNSAKGYLTYHDTDHGFSFDYPSDWSVSGFTFGSDSVEASMEAYGYYELTQGIYVASNSSYMLPSDPRFMDGGVKTSDGSMTPQGLVLRLYITPNPKGLSVEDFISGSDGLDHGNKDHADNREEAAYHYQQLHRDAANPALVEEVNGMETVCGKKDDYGQTAGYYAAAGKNIIQMDGSFIESLDGSSGNLPADTCMRLMNEFEKIRRSFKGSV